MYYINTKHLSICFLFLSKYIDTDHSKAQIKEDENNISKTDEKTCNNPLAGLANTVNSITNGAANEESTNISVSIPLTASNKHAPPKAMVKPQVLTHVIEGFVIQEGIYAFQYMYKIYYIIYIYTYI